MIELKSHKVWAHACVNAYVMSDDLDSKGAARAFRRSGLFLVAGPVFIIRFLSGVIYKQVGWGYLLVYVWALS